MTDKPLQLEPNQLAQGKASAGVSVHKKAGAQSTPDSSYQSYLFGSSGSEEHPAWSDSTKGRAAIRLFSRGVVGAAFFTIGGRMGKIHMQGYDPNASWGEIKVLALTIIIGTAIALGSMKSLNALLLGENYAQSLGVKIQRSRLLIVLSTSLMSGAVTAFCGPIAFIGLAVPHLVRMILKTSNHKILLPAVMMGGASLILLCDILAQMAGRTQSLPLNAITSLIGAPVVIWVVIRSRNSKI